MSEIQEDYLFRKLVCVNKTVVLGPVGELAYQVSFRDLDEVKEMVKASALGDVEHRENIELHGSNLDVLVSKWDDARAYEIGNVYRLELVKEGLAEISLEEEIEAVHIEAEEEYQADMEHAAGIEALNIEPEVEEAAEEPVEEDGNDPHVLLDEEVETEDTVEPVEAPAPAAEVTATEDMAPIEDNPVVVETPETVEEVAAPVEEVVPAVDPEVLVETTAPIEDLVEEAPVEEVVEEAPVEPAVEADESDYRAPVASDEVPQS